MPFAQRGGNDLGELARAARTREAGGMDAIPDQGPSWSAFRPAAPVPLMFEDSRAGGTGPSTTFFRDDPLSRERLRLLGALDQVVEARYERILDAQCTALAGIIFDAYCEWKEAGHPSRSQ